MAGLAQTKPGMSGSSERSITPGVGSAGRSRAEQSSNPWRSTAHSVRNRCITGGENGRTVDTAARRGADPSRPMASTASSADT